MITDRTAQDVARWKELHDKGWNKLTAAEQAEWSGEMKGRYSFTDMNRVESAVEALSGRFVDEGYLDTPLTVKTNWRATDVPTKADMARYLGNIARLRDLILAYPSTPLAPTVEEKFNFERANDIEQILLDVDEILTAIPQGWFYVGEIVSGEV